MYYVIGGTILLILILVGIVKYEQIKYHKKMLWIIEENFGKPREQDIDEEDTDQFDETYVKHLTFYTRIHEVGLDEITKNDVMFMEFFKKSIIHIQQ